MSIPREELGLSPEQEDAACAEAGDRCVLAGAGSGKTRVLVARYLWLVLDRALPVSRVAALTFTERAAREMRKRIGEAFAQHGHEELRAQSAEAPISTLHAFCSRLLRRNAVAAGLDPGFRVLDESSTLLVRAEALDRARQRLEARNDASTLRAALQRLGVPDPLREVARMHERLRAAGGDIESLAWARGEPSLEAARQAVAQALPGFEEASAAFFAPEPALRARAGEVAEAARDALVPGGDLWRATRRLQGLVPRGGQGVRAMQSAAKKLREALEALRGAVADDEGERTVLPALREVLVEVDAAYEEVKAQREALDFNDLERHALRLLEGLEGRGLRAEGLPQAMLVDEHQDTNPVQEQLLDLLRRQGVEQFSVGDPKQSIYRFRGADVRVLLQERERVGPARQHRLEESYRATPGLVDAVNGLCSSMFAAEAAGVPFEPLRAAGSFDPPPEGGRPDLELWLLDRGTAGTGEGREGEATCVAHWLRTLVASGTWRRNARDRRLLRYEDCAVMVRTNSGLAPLERALTDAGVPFRVHRGQGFFEADEVRALVHALRVVHNPRDTFALAALLRGPALGACDSDLLRLLGGGGDAWERARADTDPRVMALAGAVERLRQRGAHGDLPGLVDCALHELRLLPTALAQPDGPRRAANLLRAVSVARELAAAGRHDLPAFLRHLELLDRLEVTQAEAPALGAGTDVVTLLTAHAAKGLEWPVVVLADINRGAPSESGSWLARGGDAVALSLSDPLEGVGVASLGLEALRKQEKQAGLQEALRLLYVALTRAEQHLLVVGNHGGFTTDGRVARPSPWTRALLDAVPGWQADDAQEHDLGTGRLRVCLEPLAQARDRLAAQAPRAASAAAPGSGGASTAEEQAAQRIAACALTPPPLGGTRYEVGVSELLRFAASPRAYYEERLRPRLPASPTGRVASEGGSPWGEAPAAGEGVDEAAARAQAGLEQRLAWDEEPATAAPEVADDPEARERIAAERSALGRAVHLVLERWQPGLAPEAARKLLASALQDELGDGVPAPLLALGEQMVARFGRSAAARDLAQALAQGLDVRREASFRARLAFPEGARVGGLPSLLVRGTFDLWLPRGGGTWLLDHKTNPPRVRLPRPEDLAAHYAPQLRLYALAAERLLGQDVRGASLLLLDPGWGDEAVEVPVSLEGEHMLQMRRLCQAFAVAECEQRWPDAWEDLLR